MDKVGPANQASRGTFAWINATWAKQPRDYHRLNQAGLAGWKALQEDIEIPIRWEGSLEWFDEPVRQERLTEQIAEQGDWGEPARMVKAVIWLVGAERGFWRRDKCCVFPKGRGGGSC